jgi:two-component system sensor histidine kinase/response regulator
MSHELRTPLNAILGFTQLMDGDPNLTAEQQENLGIINRSGEHLLTLINDVLEMSKIEAGRVTIQERSFDLYRLLGSLEEMFGLRARAKGLRLSFCRAEDVPQYVRADEGKLRQILSNLLGNAVKFTQEGGVALRVTTLSHSQTRGTLHFEVEDTGPGIAPDQLVAVFDPFVQAASGQRAQEGTGLGLSISQQYVHLMGGEIVARSEMGQGSVFEFDIQANLSKQTAAEAKADRLVRQVIGLEPGQPVYRLLVAEDREASRRLLVKLLGNLGPPPLGFEVRQASNGREAIEIWERWEPHLIWMDMRMPVMDGYEATRRIKATDKGAGTVIIALTASAFEEDRERVLAEGCDDFVRKPFRKDEIYDMLAKRLGVRFIYEQEAAQPAAVRPADATALLIAALASLPSDWLADLQQATIKANLNLIMTLIGQIQAQNPVLANALTEMAHDFHYKKILELIEQAGGGR